MVATYNFGSVYTSHWLKVHSIWLKNYVSVKKVYFDLVSF